MIASEIVVMRLVFSRNLADPSVSGVAAWQERGWTPSGWFLERYNCPRYTVPDEKGNVILDYCAYLLPISKE